MLTSEQMDIIEAAKSIYDGYEDTNILMVSANAGTGKEQPLTAKIYTPNGYKLMGDIEVGDTILHPTKGTSTVAAIHPQGLKDVYEVHFIDGTYVECGEYHLWSYYCENNKKNELVTEPLKYLIDQELKKDNDFIYYVPTAKTIDFIDNKIEYDENMKEYIYKNLLKTKEVRFKIYDEIFLRKKAYSKYDNEFKSKCITIEEKDKETAEAIQQLVLSLSTISTLTEYKKDNEIIYKIKIILKYPKRYITKIIKTNKKVEQQCITISEPDGLYITDNFTVTHNTFILQEIEKKIMDKGKNGIYLAYNASIAKEAKSKFKYLDCRTVHSLAHKFTVKELGMKISNNIEYKFNRNLKTVERDIAKNIFNSFCLSDSTNFDDFARTRYSKVNSAILKETKEIFRQMQSKKIPATFNFFLKLFHLNIKNKNITFDEFDFIALDESGDVNRVIFDIFLSMPAKLKVAVGDSKQNIYQFNETINGFKKIEDEAILKTLNKSFRVSKDIANKINVFCNKYIENGVKFEGIDIKDYIVKTTAYIGRTNYSLIEKAFELKKEGKKFNTTRQSSSIIGPLIELNILNKDDEMFEKKSSWFNLNTTIEEHNRKKKRLKMLNKRIDLNKEEELEKYSLVSLFTKFDTRLKYVVYVHSDDKNLKSAMSILSKYGLEDLVSLKKKIDENNKKNQNITISTAHSSKGLEFDRVIIMKDLEDSIEKTIKKISIKSEDIDIKEMIARDKEAEQDVFLYYVACSRAKYELIGAKFLEECYTDFL